MKNEAVEEFCKNDAAPLVRECPDCIDKFIFLAQKYEFSAKQYEAENVKLRAGGIYLGEQNAKLRKELEETKLQVSRHRKVLEEIYSGAEKHSGFWARETVAPFLFCAVCRKLLPCAEHIIIEKPINEQCWCAAKAETKDAVCPIHDTENRVAEPPKVHTFVAAARCFCDSPKGPFGTHEVACPMHDR